MPFLLVGAIQKETNTKNKTVADSTQTNNNNKKLNYIDDKK